MALAGNIKSFFLIFLFFINTCIVWTQNILLAKFSGKGSAVDISAPGVNIFSSWLGSEYKTASGTSMATPMASGTVALIKFTHPSYSVAQIENALFKTAKDLGKLGKDTSYGWGRVDANGAVNYVAS